MKKLRKQIKESFFNPIFHFLPLLLFLVVDDFYGMTMAWEISFPFALLLLIYVFFAYNRIFAWHLVFTTVFVSSTIIAAFLTLLPIFRGSHEIVSEIVVLVILIVFILFRKQGQKIVLRSMSEFIPMTNNFNELFQVIWVFVLVLFFYITGFLIVKTINGNVYQYQHMLQYIYVGTLFFLSIYEILRVQIIRSKLLREDWLPIVNEHGKIIGSIQSQISLNDEKKYLHPVVRILFIDKSMVLLEKKTEEVAGDNDLWDSTISNHVQVNQTIEQCVEKTVENKYAINGFKYMYLSKYIIESKKEKQYAFLFISCLQSDFKLNSETAQQTKWWTKKQIEENLNSGIFTENFKIEYDLLKRSGVLESGKCNCNCRLRDVIYQQPTAIKEH